MPRGIFDFAVSSAGLIATVPLYPFIWLVIKDSARMPRDY